MLFLSHNSKIPQFIEVFFIQTTFTYHIIYGKNVKAFSLKKEE